MKRSSLAMILTMAMAAATLAGCGSSDSGSAASTTAASEAEEASTETTEVSAETSEAEEASAFTGEGLNEATEINVAVLTTYPEWSVNTQNQTIENEFAADGITINYQEFSYGVPALEALAAGDIDFVISGDLPVITNIANGVGVQAVYLGIMDPSELAVVAPADSDIASVADLAGKTIGYPIGTDAHNFLGQLLATADLTLDDIESVNLKAADLEVALSNGEVDAVAIWQPTADGIVEDIDAKVVLTSGEDTYVPFKFLSVRTDFANENPELTARFVKAIDEIDQWIMDNLEETIDIVIADRGGDAAYWGTLLNSEYNGDFTDADKAAAQETIDFLTGNDLITGSVEVDQIYTDIYWNEAQALAQ